jgi:hypothetical protein
MSTKMCGKCKQEKDINCFYKHKVRSGFSSSCKDCESLRHKEKWKASPTLRKHSKELSKIRRADPIKKEQDRLILKQKLIDRPELREKERRRNRKRYAENKEYRRNIKRLNARFKKNKRLNTFYKFKDNIRKLISKAIRSMGFSKKSKAFDILGCSAEEFKIYMESKFQPGMSWKNNTRYGWHIDHIIPISSAQNEEQAIKLNHYSNLQPLWAIDNLKKSNKV